MELKSSNNYQDYDALLNLDLEVLAYAFKNESATLPLPMNFSNLALQKFPGLYLDALMDAGKIRLAIKSVFQLLSAKEKPPSGFPWNQIDRLRGILINDYANYEDQFEGRKPVRFLMKLENYISPWIVQPDLSELNKRKMRAK